MKKDSQVLRVTGTVQFPDSNRRFDQEAANKLCKWLCHAAYEWFNGAEPPVDNNRIKEERDEYVECNFTFTKPTFVPGDEGNALENSILIVNSKGEDQTFFLSQSENDS